MHPVFDILYQAESFQPGQTYRGLRSRVIPAGKGINVAKVVHRLGEEVNVVGVLPHDGRERFERYLDRQGIEHHFLEIPGLMRYNTTILEDDGRVTHLNSFVDQEQAIPAQAVLEHYKAHIRGNQQWVLTGSVVPGLQETIYKDLIQALPGTSSPTILDASGAPFRHGLKARPTMVKPNLAELEEYFQEPIRGTHHIALKGKRILDMGIDYVFITLGSDGMIALHGNDCLLCSVPSVRVVDTVGCGDALVAGIMVGLRKMYSFTEMCRLAIACGVSNALHRGAGEIEADEVWRIAEEIGVTAV